MGMLEMKRKDLPVLLSQIDGVILSGPAVVQPETLLHLNCAEEW